VTNSEPVIASPVRSASRTHGELALRVASALVLAPVALVTAYLGGVWFIALWTLIAVGIAWEWTRLVLARTHAAVLASVWIALAAAGVLFAARYPGSGGGALLIGMLLTGILAPAGKRTAATAGAAYAGAMLAAPTLLRADVVYGLVAVIFLFAVVWMTDIAAYFAGRLVGGPKLWPAVSPKKTWSGAIGGAAVAVAAGIAVAFFAGLDNWVALGSLSLGLSVLAQIGDFSESAIKRRFGAKDASHLIPGHGGLMDRLDGFWAAAVAATVLGVARGGVDAPAQGLLLW
jgi:phosphatidate cytidylyltransferase